MGAAAPDPTLTIVWEPQEGPQTALLTCPVFEVFFGGARGGGKTDGMLGEFASHADLYGENAIGLMVRRERTQLLETIERSKQIYGLLGWKYSEQQSTWRAPNGARLRFAHLERDSDADAYQGHSYTRVYVEEAGTFPSETPILKLMATLRSGAGVPCGMRLTGNPGGPGQHWVKARYIDPCPQGWKVQHRTYKSPFTGEPVTRDWVYIPSKVTDNQYLGSDYVANLQMVGSPELVRAWLEGDWNVIEGAYFPEFNYARHVLNPHEFPDHLTRIRAADWGSYRPFSVGWYYVADGEFTPPGHNHPLPRGAMVKYREWYGMQDGRPNLGLKLTAEEVKEGIIARETGKEKINDSVIDPAAFNQDGGPSIAERMLPEVQWRPADNRRIAKLGAIGGWDQLRQRLKGNDDGPLIYFFSTCTHTIRTIPALQHDKQRPEDLDTESEDHAADETRYAVMSRPLTKLDIKPEAARWPLELTINEMIERQKRKRLAEYDD